MVRITPFAVEQWMDAYETTPGVLNVAETCAASVSIDDLVTMSSGPAKSPIDTSIKLTYGAIPGSLTLRERIAAHCSTEGVQLAPEDVIVTQGAIGANFLALYTLIGPGDHVICVYPTYQQLYDTPRSLGAEVTLWKLKKENGFVPDVDELAGLIKPNTKMIIINNPNNPTGAPIPSSVIGRIAKFAEENGIILFSDEVYRPLFHGGASGGDHTEVPRPVTTLDYRKTIATGSMSKGYALAGIRVGWIASRDRSIISAIMLARDYTTISVSQIDDQIARFALSPEVKPALVQRNIRLARTNAAILKDFMDRYKSVCSWVEPKAGTTAFIRFNDKNGDPVDDVKLCLDLLEKAKLLFVAGSRCFGGDADFKGYVRMGYVCETDVLVDGLKELGAYIDKSHQMEGLGISKAASKVRNWRRPCKLEIELADHYLAKIYSSGSIVHGRLAISPTADICASSITISLDGITTIRSVGQQLTTTTTHRFLKIDFISPDILQLLGTTLTKGHSYRIPFQFTLPHQLDSTACTHDAVSAAVTGKHLLPPPTVGREWDRGDMSPGVVEVEYGINACVISTPSLDTAYSQESTAKRTIRFIPRLSESPPLHVSLANTAIQAARHQISSEQPAQAFVWVHQRRRIAT
ncbi:type I transaminase [Fusarium denticulatum]|uniref:Type I transaminase n=1 Tax=Fusarium denticulatum TaxID=48507 RepID=A0A8H5UDT3_9HYPO|nr:type I transaminase [Fusarium denticulatum]